MDWFQFTGIVTLFLGGVAVERWVGLARRIWPHKD